MKPMGISGFPREAMYGNHPANQRNLASVVHGLRTTVDEWARTKLVKNHESFGFAIADVTRPVDWDDPYSFVWFVVGWGPESDRYIANAVRKLRPALRHSRDTLDLRINAPGVFQDIVPSVDDDGKFPWGDFPWGGATFVRVGNLMLPCSVSGLRETEDDAAAKMIGSHIGVRMLKLDHPDEFDA